MEFHIPFFRNKMDDTLLPQFSEHRDAKTYKYENEEHFSLPI